jgi:dTMP kinase
VVVGRFIAFEGADGVGKSTAIRLVADLLRDQGIDVLVTREPGGSPGAEQIRQLLVQGEVGRWTPTAELLLHAAARAEHVETVIRPTLAAGKWVLTDRYVGSTVAYQGVGHGLGRDLIMEVHRLTVGLLPDTTVVLTLPPEVAAQRLNARAGAGAVEDRYERMGDGFGERVRAGYAQLLDDPDLDAIAVDASLAPDELAEAIVDLLV